MSETRSNPTPGRSTTEFWITAVIQLLALLLGIYGSYKGNETLVGMAVALSGGSGSVYAALRTSLKRSAASNSAMDALSATNNALRDAVKVLDKEGGGGAHG